MRIAVFLLALLLIATIACAAPDERGLAVRPKAPTGEVVKGEQWVLTIGIDSYLSWPRLKTAANDAKALKNVLLERYHVDQSRVIELYNENATRRNILGSLRDLSKKVKPDDSLFIFYAGHGHVDNITKKGSWIPVESNTDDSSSWISNQDVKDYLNIDAIKAKHVLLVSDSCFSGDFFRGTRGALPEVTDTVIKKAYQLSSRQAITSGGLEPVSDAGFGGNSVFSHFLVTALKNNTKPYLIPSELFPAIKSGVAQNADQFPQMGSLYGVGGQEGGELVLFLKQENKLENLSAGSVARQKELEQLQKVEAEAAAAKQKEQAEIAKKQAELDKLDKQIAEMKGRLGSGAANSSDSLDAMVVMAEQKAEQGRRLEELRKQREAEEQKRQAEIKELKQEAFEKRIAQIIQDVEKYQKVAENEYAKNMKGAAWDALVATYPEAKKAKRYNLDTFLAIHGLTFDEGSIVTIRDKQLRKQQLAAEKKEKVAKDRAAKAALLAEKKSAKKYKTNGSRQPVQPETYTPVPSSGLPPIDMRVFMGQGGSQDSVRPVVEEKTKMIGSQRLDLSGLGSEERQSIELACIIDKSNGPARYNQCLQQQLTMLSSGSPRPNLSGLGSEERQSIELACIIEKSNGPARYNQCLQQQQSMLSSGSRRPNLSGFSREDRQSIELACIMDKSRGPATYNQCLINQLRSMDKY